MSFVRVKSLSLFNLDDLIADSAKKLWEFVSRYSIENKQDIYSLFCFYNLSGILDAYKKHKGIIVFYMSTKCHNWLMEEDGIVRGMDFKKFIRLITKRIQFPIIISSLSFDGFNKMLSEGGPEYDELISGYEFVASLYNDIVDVVKQLKFYRIEDELINSVTEQIKLISTF